MSFYQPPFSISNQMLSLVASISESIGRISLLQNLESKPHLRKNNRISSIHASLKIEANSLSLNQVRDVINGHIVLGEQKEIQEVKNAYAAYDELGKFDPYNIQDLLHLHNIMTRYIIDEAGVFRKGEEGVFSGEECIFMAPPARFVPQLMQDLFSWMQKEKTNLHPLILAAVFHYEFVFIHPFADGNGRMARLWHTAILGSWKPLFAYLPLESQIEKFQDGYYEAISACHKNGNSNAFIVFMLEQINTVLTQAASQPYTSENTSEYVKRLLQAMEPETPYTATTLLEILNLHSKETLRKNYLNPALKLGVIAMTIPDKPKSRNQRYIKH